MTDTRLPVRPADLPANALLVRYREGGGFTDCHAVDVPLSVTHAAFVEAFFTTALFGVERLLLRVFARRPSTREQARLLASGRDDAFGFAAWTVEARAPRQLLLRDFTGRTRTWLMTEPVGTQARPATRLYLGSALLPRADGTAATGLMHGAMLRFHDVYSRVLLGAARRRLMRRSGTMTGDGQDEPTLTTMAAPTTPVRQPTPTTPTMRSAPTTRSTQSTQSTPTTPTTRAPSSRRARAKVASTHAAPAAPATPAAPAAPDPAARPRGASATWRARPTREQIAAMPPFEALPLERIVLVRTPSQCEAALRALERARFVGFDTESKPTFTRDAVRDGPHVIQFATPDQGFVVQVDDRVPIEFLRAALDTEAIVKVGFGLNSDQAPLEHKLALRLRGTVEVSQVLRRLGHKDALGAKSAVAVVLGQRLQKSKTVQTSNWGAAELTPQQIRYAANDAYAALMVYRAMGSPYPVR